ncbi:MAG: hypothetical protein COA88_02945 [Kordia sp.]|nr:MAG: hypothetical protein COA88_02945 [Kordia sp.]
MIKITTQLTEKDYLRYVFKLAYSKVGRILLTIVGLIMLLSSIAYYLSSFMQSISEDTPYIPLFLGFFIVVGLPVIQYFETKKTFNTHQNLKEEMTYEFTDDLIKITGGSFKSEMQWDKLYKVKELKEWVLLYHSKAVANIIPKRDLESQITEFRELVRKQDIPHKLKK